MYDKAKDGSYTMKTPDFKGGYFEQTIKVWVIGESDKSYLIVPHCPVRGHRGGDQMKVRKHNVHVHGMSAPAVKRSARSYDYTNAFWND